MKVARTIQIKTDDLMVGDQINVKLKGFGKFTATAQKIEGDKILFLFDEIVTKYCMNEQNINEGGFDASGLKKWLNEVLLPVFPKKLQSRITELTIPTYGEVFGHDDFYKNFEPDNDEQLPSMKRRGNRSCDFDGDWEWWWLRNAMKKEKSAAAFAHVSSRGGTSSGNASGSLGVRPEFWLVK